MCEELEETDGGGGEGKEGVKKAANEESWKGVQSVAPKLHKSCLIFMVHMYVCTLCICMNSYVHYACKFTMCCIRKHHSAC